MTNEAKKKLEQFLELVSVEGDIKGEAKLGSFLKKNVATKFESLNAKLDELSKKINDIKLPDVPETDLSPVISSIQAVKSDIKNIKIPQPKDIKIPEPKDWTANFQAIYGLLGDILRMVDENKIDKDEYEEVKKDITKLKGIGRSMYQDWQEDSTNAGTLSGDVDGVNDTFTLRNRAVNGIVFLFRNGVLEKLSDFSVSTDQKTIVYSGFLPQTGDNITARYPK